MSQESQERLEAFPKKVNYLKVVNKHMIIHVNYILFA